MLAFHSRLLRVVDADTPLILTVMFLHRPHRSLHRILRVGICMIVAMTSMFGAEILQLLAKEYQTSVGPEALEVAGASAVVAQVAKQLEPIQNLKKDEFETTAEFQARRKRELEASTEKLSGRLILPAAAESVYDADTGKLTVSWPSQLFIGTNGNATINVLPYGSRWPEDFMAKGQSPTLVLPLAREEARALKPNLTWLIIARLPLGELVSGGVEERVVTVTPRRTQLTLIPLAALLYAKADGRILYRLAFDLPANLRVLAPDATLQDWIAASDVVRARVIAQMFPDAKTDAMQLWLDVRGALERKQIASTEPLATLLRVPELPKPTAPVAVKQTRPKYPFEMRRAGIAGEVVVRFRIKEDGGVAELSAERSSQREFEAAAIACVAQWRFRPATLGGKPISVVMSVPIVFSLGEE